MMRSRFGVILIVLIITSRGVAAQGGNGAVSLSQASAERARAVIADAISALGGEPALRRVRSVTRELTGDRTDVGQGGAPRTFHAVHDRVGAVPPVVNRSKTRSVRDLVNMRSVEDLSYDIYGGQRVSRRNVLGRSEGFTAFFDYVYHGLRRMSAPALQRARSAAFRRYPESLLLSALDRPEALRSQGVTRWEGRPHQIVVLADVDGTQASLFFDSATHRLSKVETLGEDGVLGDITIETIYQDYRSVRDLVLPFHYIDRRGGVVLDDLRASSIVLDAPIDESLFMPPVGFEPVDFGPAFPNLQQLGDGVYTVLGGYNTVFVAFNDYVLVLEAGGSSREAESVIALIKQTAPGKPIRYVVTTHWNFDHVAGVRPYVAEGATIIAPPSARSVIERAIAAPRTLHPDALSRNPRPLAFESLGARQRTFTDGTHNVVVYDISPSPHVDEMYVAYLPKEKVLFEADLLDIIVPGRVGTGGEDTADLAAKIQGLGLQVERIVPAHGQIGTIEDLRQALGRRSINK